MADSGSKTTLADRAVQLVQQLKRNPDIMPPYNDEGVRFCTNGVKELYNECSATYASSQTDKTITTEINNQKLAIMQFVIRCCTAYAHERAKRIKSYRWKYGGVLPISIKKNLCEAEIDFFNKYCASLATFQVSLGEEGIDLMRCTHPPQSLFLMVRALQDYGEFQTTDGNTVVLIKNSIHSLPRQDCEMLIKQGVLEIAN